MLKTNFIISSFAFIVLLIFTSTIKNKTRIIEKKIISLKKDILPKKNSISEAQLDFYYLTSPAKIEKKLNLIGFDNYEPIKYSKIFLNISDYEKFYYKITKLKYLDEKKIQK